MLGMLCTALMSLGLLELRNFQRVVINLQQNPNRDHQRCILISVKGTQALNCWRHKTLLMKGLHLPERYNHHRSLPDQLGSSVVHMRCRECMQLQCELETFKTQRWHMVEEHPLPHRNSSSGLTHG